MFRVSVLFSEFLQRRLKLFPMSTTQWPVWELVLGLSCNLILQGSEMQLGDDSRRSATSVSCLFLNCSLFMMSLRLYSFPGVFFQSLNREAETSFTLLCYVLSVNAPASQATGPDKGEREKWSEGSCHPLESRVPLTAEEVSLPENFRCLRAALGTRQRRKEK